MISNDILKSIVKSNFGVNTKNIVGIMAYGSSVIPQKNNKGKMVDLMIIVKDSNSFHSNNLIHNPTHYSLLARLFKTSFTSRITNITPNIYFLHSIKLKLSQQQNMNNESTNKSSEELNEIYTKYGIAQLNTIQSQYHSFDNFFMMGRLQKPIKIEYNYEDNREESETFKEVIRLNKTSALKLSLLLTIDGDSKYKLLTSHNYNNQEYNDLLKEIFTNIVSLSYLGDIRFKIKGEKVTKIRDIVDGGYDYFVDYYKPTIKENVDFFNKNNIDSYNAFINSMIHSLPKELVSQISNKNKIENANLKEYLSQLTFEERRKVLITYLEKVNFSVSCKALFSSFLASKVIKGFVYVFNKYKKFFSK